MVLGKSKEAYDIELREQTELASQYVQRDRRWHRGE